MNYESAKKNFEAKQEELARFRDANKNFNTALAKTREEKLLSEYSLLLNIYTELAKQKEQAKIAVKETTPIFTIISPAVIPNERSKPKRTQLLFVYIFIGSIIGSSIVLGIQFIENNFIPNIRKFRISQNIH